MRHAIQSRERKLDAYFDRAKKQAEDDELTSDLAKFGAVLACGYVERCVELIILDRLANRAHDRVLNFFKAFFKRGTNYDCEAICQLIVRFDTAWERKFRALIEANDNWVSSLTSLYTLRNSVAHGGTLSRGLAGVRAMYEDCKLLIEGLIKATE